MGQRDLRRLAPDAGRGAVHPARQDAGAGGADVRRQQPGRPAAGALRGMGRGIRGIAGRQGGRSRRRAIWRGRACSRMRASAGRCGTPASACATPWTWPGRGRANCWACRQETSNLVLFDYEAGGEFRVRMRGQRLTDSGVISSDLIRAGLSSCPFTSLPPDDDEPLALALLLHAAGARLEQVAPRDHADRPSSARPATRPAAGPRRASAMRSAAVRHDSHGRIVIGSRWIRS